MATFSAMLVIAAGCHLIGDVDDTTFQSKNAGGGPASSSSAEQGSGGNTASTSNTSSSGAGNNCDPSDCPEGSPCAPATCTNGECGFLSKPEGAPCEGIPGFCTDEGSCVDCTQPQHCDAGYLCIELQCIDEDCMTHSDCVSPDYYCSEELLCVEKKDDGAPCNNHYECLSDVCGEGNMCVPDD